MVVVPKKSGTVRICVDLKPLNESVMRETHPLPKVDDNLAQLAGASIVSKLDENSGFWQIPLTEKSRLLTTFITPFIMPPEHFQKRMSTILEGLEGILCQIDDILIFGSDQKQHDGRLVAALQHIQEVGITRNAEKCEFSQSQLTFLGHIVDKHGVRADPSRIAAIKEMKTPTTVSELGRFLGMAN